MVILLMGVCGSGKTLIGQRLAAALGWTFYDADDFHSPQNVQKMRSGVPLTEEDRGPWLATLAGMIRGAIEEKRDIVMGCSALTVRSRAILGTDLPQVRVVHLKGDRELIRQRMEHRTGHYMPPGLLDTQFETLQEDPAAVAVDVSLPPDAIIAAIRQRLAV